MPGNGGNMEKQRNLLKIENAFCMRCKHQGCLMFGRGGCPALISFSESKENQNTEVKQNEKG